MKKPGTSGDHSKSHSSSFAVHGHHIVIHRQPETGLYIVSTPIGNLGDISIRALETLASVDEILCEDTRHARKLTSHFQITTRLSPYHEHNAVKRRPEVLAKLKEGGCIALISDAGTPLVSDPGYKLVMDVRQEDIPVIPIPGASATLAALVGAGLPSDRFFFEGFLPSKKVARTARLAELKAIPATLIIYEAPGRVADCLSDAARVFGDDHPACLARELTKKFETFSSGPLATLAAANQEKTPRGECVILIGPPDDTQEGEPDWDAIDRALGEAIAAEGVKRASERLATRFGLPRKQIYTRALDLRNKTDLA